MGGLLSDDEGESLKAFAAWIILLDLRSDSLYSSRARRAMSRISLSASLAFSSETSSKQARVTRELQLFYETVIHPMKQSS